MLERSGDRITAFSSDGILPADGDLVVWDFLAEVSVAMDAAVYVGVAATSHSAGT